MALTSWLHLCPGGAISSLTDHDLTASEPRAHSGFSLYENDAPRNAISHQFVCWIWDKCRSLTIAEDSGGAHSLPVHQCQLYLSVAVGTEYVPVKCPCGPDVRLTLPMPQQHQ